eukprot:m.18478 g.18478  ORF g.18478 m.18478 type:complete len:93 (-) comp10816_c0_seq2:187-465(-)
MLPKQFAPLCRAVLREHSLSNAGEQFKHHFIQAVRNELPARTGLGTSTNVQNLALLMQSRRQYLELYHEYHKGELSVEQAAKRVGFALPERR